jgi:hypothetical protein
MAIAPTDSPAPRSPSSATWPKARGAGRKLTAAHADDDDRTVHDGASLSTSPSPSRSTTTSRSTKTITMLRERVGSRQRIAMRPTTRHVTNPQRVGRAPSEPHSKHFRSAAPIRARTPLAHHANVIIGAVVRRGRFHAVPVARGGTLPRR